MSYIFKIANHDDEFQQIHRLNYRTFVEEIPQHQRNENEILVDSFHEQNTYLICLNQKEVIGMIAIREERPFSLDKKIGRVEDWLPFEAAHLCEIRLLAVKKVHRNGRVFLGLAKLLARYSQKKGYDVAVISGTTRQLKLYQHMGFQPFAHRVGTAEAEYQPMFLTKETMLKGQPGSGVFEEVIRFLPGPVRIRSEVKEALALTPIPHRSAPFMKNMAEVRNRLCELTHAKKVSVILGTGTLANDIIAAQLRKISGQGLILTNGEFGERLVDHGKRAALDFVVLRKEWGTPYTKEEICEILSSHSIQWLWFVHCETSTGMLNPLDMLKEICLQYRIKLCVDCISSLGTVPLNLEDVFLASGVSGKGIGAFTGLSFVFHHHRVSASENIPRYLDLGMYCDQMSVPYSQSSNLLFALFVALKNISEQTYQNLKDRYGYLREKAEGMGLFVLAPSEHASPFILTVQLPQGTSSVAVGEEMYLQGYQLHYESSYLQRRNWLQIACSGEFSKVEMDGMLTCLEKVTMVTIF